MDENTINIQGRALPLEEWKKGDPLYTYRLNQPVKVLQALVQGVKPPRGKTPEVKPPFVQQFKILEIADDYLVCNPYDGETQLAEEILVARPYLLRMSLASWNGLTFTYVDEQSRVATLGAETEDQTIVPQYVVGDIIYGLQGIFGGTAVEDDDEKVVQFVDLNIDGRAFAQVAE